MTDLNSKSEETEQEPEQKSSQLYFKSSKETLVEYYTKIELPPIQQSLRQSLLEFETHKLYFILYNEYKQWKNSQVFFFSSYLPKNLLKFIMFVEVCVKVCKI